MRANIEMIKATSPSTANKTSVRASLSLALPCVVTSTFSQRIIAVKRRKGGGVAIYIARTLSLSLSLLLYLFSLGRGCSPKNVTIQILWWVSLISLFKRRRQTTMVGLIHGKGVLCMLVRFIIIITLISRKRAMQYDIHTHTQTRIRF